MDLEQKPKVHEAIYDQILCYEVRYVDGCTVRFPYSEYGKADAKAFIEMKFDRLQIAYSTK